MKIRIGEIITRSAQGITRPFLCRADDGMLYYVKGNAAGRKALISEWIAGNLGRRLGLPIPNFFQAVIPPELITYSARDDAGDLGGGIGFASKFVENADELTYLFIGQVESKLRAKILLFDWWTANADRTLSEHGGNPNILWSHSAKKPFVIDHNLALEKESLENFWRDHIFADARTHWNQAFQKEMTPMMLSALNDLASLWNDLPDQWTEFDIGLTLQSVNDLLWRFDQNPANFWGIQ